MIHIGILIQLWELVPTWIIIYIVTCYASLLVQIIMRKIGIISEVILLSTYKIWKKHREIFIVPTMCKLEVSTDENRRIKIPGKLILFFWVLLWVIFKGRIEENNGTSPWLQYVKIQTSNNLSWNFFHHNFLWA